MVSHSPLASYTNQDQCSLAEFQRSEAGTRLIAPDGYQRSGLKLNQAQACHVGSAILAWLFYLDQAFYYTDCQTA